ncbi:peptidoglycan-binding protein [Streptomyces sp. NBC_00683]|uniref:peptidoglycan-binding domain-containing protein n=1 Tax=Streptomyces sp. NBC_00683 TaxID=2903670 RepID=UPI002E32B7F3|nr:peptidoglycan-binding domain-containing protein [Streptomyces sp. NBC_00683]
MTGHICPECGGEQSARPGPGGAGPGSTGHRCACGTRTAQLPGEEHRAARSAEMAAAEDFDPLRIRPYVTLSSDAGQEHTAPAAATTMPIFMGGAAGAGAVGAGAAGDAAGRFPDADPVDESRRRTAAAYAGGGPEPVQPRRRRPFAVLAAGVAVVAVVGTAAFAGGLFDKDDSREEALPEVATSVPDASGPADSVSESPSASPSSTPSRSASASPSSSPSASASKSPSASPSATASRTPSPSATATQSPEETSAPPAQIAGPTLRRGDQGAEVAELQRRLQEIWVYREPDNGEYSERVERAVREFQTWVSVQSDPPGVYGPETRRALEAQTTGNGRHS